MMNTLLWFQRDLRIHNNPALNWAIDQGNPIIAVYIHSPEEDRPWSEGAASRWWLHHSLKKLSSELITTGIKLEFFKGNSVDIIPRLVTDYDINAAVWTNRYEPHRRSCEQKIKLLLSKNNIEIKRFQDGLLAQPDLFLTASSKTAYRIFTPFYKRLRSSLNLSDFYQNDSINKNQNIRCYNRETDNLELDQLELLDQHPWHEKLHKHWSPGETSAAKKLELFIDESINDYVRQRDLPAKQGTSTLSPHLHFGEVSPQQIIMALAPLLETQSSKAAEAFLRQLIWREFAHYILWHFPQTASRPMNSKFNQSFWKTNNRRLKKWQQGETGIALVDAGMKQLWETGWVHNRLRMLVASLLTKNLGISWQSGARWFWDTLVDADLANNSMGWQWVAGCGVDAAPYFRIFNPDIQAKKFDKQHSYINYWLDNPETIEPIIDLASSRTEALQRYKHLTENQS